MIITSGRTTVQHVMGHGRTLKCNKIYKYTCICMAYMGMEIYSIGMVNTSCDIILYLSNIPVYGKATHSMIKLPL